MNNIQSVMQSLRTIYFLLLFLVICQVVPVEQEQVSINEDFSRNHTDSLIVSTKQMTEQHKTRMVFNRRSPVMFAHPIIYTTGVNLTECTDSIAEFPTTFSKEQLQNGALVFIFIVGAYCFIIVATICDSYFIPCMEHICGTFSISQDVAAAVFMSIATSAPELFTNVVGTFVTESDLGLGTVVGSSMFNTLGVGAIANLAAVTSIQLDWWPLCRDVVIYITAILLLVTVTWDGIIYWWESLILTSVYIIYFVVMFQNTRISNFFRKKFTKKECLENEKPIQMSTISGRFAHENNESSTDSYTNTTQSIEKSIDYKTTDLDRGIEYQCTVEYGNGLEDNDLMQDQEGESLFKRPTGKWYQKVIFYVIWPCKLVLRYSVPNPGKYPRLYPLTFAMCIVWIAITSYLISWMVTLLGYAFSIPDTILGLTFVAAGGCLPEAISVTIMSRKGEGSMGVANALGANTTNILLSLGVPWLIKAAMSTPSYIKIQSGSIEYTILALIAGALILFLILALNRFRLSKRAGIILGIIYLIFLSFAIVSELVLFKNTDCNEVI